MAKMLKRKPASLLEGEMTARPNMQKGKYGGGGGGSINWGRVAWKKAKQEFPGKTITDKILDQEKPGSKGYKIMDKLTKPFKAKPPKNLPPEEPMPAPAKAPRQPKRMITPKEKIQLKKDKYTMAERDYYNQKAENRKLKYEDWKKKNTETGKTADEEVHSAAPNQPTNLSSHTKEGMQPASPDKIKIYKTKGDIEKITGQPTKLMKAAKAMARKNMRKEPKPLIPERIKAPDTPYYEKPPLRHKWEDFKVEADYAWRMIKRKTDIDDPKKVVNLANKDVHKATKEYIDDPNKFMEKQGLTAPQIYQKGRNLLHAAGVTKGPKMIEDIDKELAMEKMHTAQQKGRDKEYDAAQSPEEIKAWNQKVKEYEKQMKKKGYKLQGDKE